MDWTSQALLRRPVLGLMTPGSLSAIGQIGSQTSTLMSLCILNQKWQMITSVDLKQIDRQIFFLAKMGLFKISRKLLFDICDQEDPHESYWTARESELLYRGKGSWEGCSKQRVHGSSLAWVLARKEEESFFCLLGSATVPEHDSSLFQAPGLYLIEVSVYECLTHPTLKRI